MKKYQKLIIFLGSVLVAMILGLFILPSVFIDDYQIRDTIPIIALFGPYIIFGFTYWAQHIMQHRKLQKNIQWFFDKFQNFTQTSIGSPLPKQKFLSLTHFFIIYEREFGRYLDFKIISTESSQYQEMFLLDDRYWIKYSIQEGLVIQISNDNCQSYHKLAHRTKMYKDIVTYCKSKFGIYLEINSE